MGFRRLNTTPQVNAPAAMGSLSSQARAHQLTTVKSRKRMAIASTMVACLLAGCKVGPNYEKPKGNLPANFQPSASPKTAPVERWWETFHDSKLNDLVIRATQSNLDLRLANARILEARSQRDIENTSFFPLAHATGAYNRQQVSKNAEGISAPSGATSTGGGAAGSPSSANGIGVPTRYDYWQAGFDAAWEIDVFGGVARSVEAATADIQVQEEARRDTLVTLLGDVARNYIIVRGTQREIRIAEDNIRSQQQTVNLTTSRFHAGLASDLEVAQSAAQVATSQATIPTLRTQEKQGLHRLAILLGQEPTAVEQELADVQPLPPAPPAVPVGLPSDLLRRRPDVRKTERQLAAATARIGVATADLFPKFSLTGGLGLESQKLRDLARGDSLFWNIGPSVSWTIFDAGRIRANIRLQDAREREAYVTYQQTVLTALEDVANALTAYEQEQIRRNELEEAVKQNRKATNISNELYSKGLVDFLNVLEAQRSLFAAEDQLVQSDRTVSSNLVALYKALGGGWEPFENGGDPTTQPSP